MASAFDLNGAASEFSIRLIRDKVAALADECNQDLTADLSELHDLLGRVDQKRIKFQDNKSNLLEGLRATLSSLRVDSAVVNTTLSDIAATSSPHLLSIIPTAATLHLESHPLTPVASPPESGLAETVDAPQLDSAGSDTVSNHSSGSKATPQEGPESDMQSGTQAASQREDREDGNVKTSPSSQALVVHREKRLRESLEDPEHESKKVKTSPNNAPAHSDDTDMPRKLRMQDLDAIECVFRHAERDGFFVIRCLEPDCSSRIADLPPFKYKRAFNHFNSKHLKQLQSEEFIFKEFAYQVEDATAEAVSARYPDNAIPDCTPKDTLPETRSTSPRPGSPRRATKSVSFNLERSPSLGFHGSDPASKTSDSDMGYSPSDTAEGDMEGSSSEPGKTRHNLRRLPRLSYTQMVHGRDPTPTDFQDQAEGEKPEYGTAKRAGTPGITSASARGYRSMKKLLKPGEKPRRFSEQPHKPFGHTGEWARRSAPS
ncbi:hypothetical protein PG991_007891 [Apiospora marii]|uniref:HSF-type DNA-binding domain-containing protein n=1 Tax=Apiospora marii TaxID=335849 RepID=A0ABR1RUR9_9PEZI